MSRFFAVPFLRLVLLTHSDGGGSLALLDAAVAGDRLFDSSRIQLLIAELRQINCTFERPGVKHE